MFDAILLRVLVTGIVAVVPSNSDPNMTRLIAPNEEHADMRFSGMPQHFAFLRVPAENVDADKSTPPDLKFQGHDDDEPFKPRDYYVYLLRSDEVSLEKSPDNLQLAQVRPSPQDKHSTYYELQMKYLCPHCPPIADAYFHLENEKKVAARMDLTGGREGVRGVRAQRYDLPGTANDHAYAEKIAYDFDVSDSTETIVIKNLDGKTTRSVVVKSASSVAGGDVEVLFGNVPLVPMLQLDRFYGGSHSEEHFKLMYDVYGRRNIQRVIPQPIYARGFYGPHDNCTGGHFPAQDPIGTTKTKKK
jgi:hypothetical protein